MVRYTYISCDYISPELRQLHWLPVRQHAVFKIATLVHRSLSGKPRVTWPTTVRSSPTPVSDNCVLLTLKHSFVSLMLSSSGHNDLQSINQSINQSKNISIAPYVATNQRRRTTSLEQSAAQSQTMWAVIRPVQAVTEDIFIRTVRPWRSALNKNILTYLLFILLRFLPKRVN